MLIELDSVNQASPGVYATQLKVFGSGRANFRALLYAYTRSGESSPCACDLIVHAASGEIFLRDFLRRPNGFWCDSDGNVADSLNQLLPSEIQYLQLEKVIELEPIEVTA